MHSNPDLYFNCASVSIQHVFYPSTISLAYIVNSNCLKGTQNCISMLAYVRILNDLCFSLFQANKYLENYERALHGFEAAASKDPGLNADDEAQKITSLLDKIESSLRVIHFLLFIILLQFLRRCRILISQFCVTGYWEHCHVMEEPIKNESQAEAF